MSQLPPAVLTVDDAREILAAAENRRQDGDLSTSEYPVELLARAGAVILGALRQADVEVERARARAADRGITYVDGAQLVAGNDGGGLRHYLRGRPVHCGAGLVLLTDSGWLEGRYERSGPEATFWFGIPDIFEEAVISIRPKMLFAWPNELRAAQASVGSPSATVRMDSIRSGGAVTATRVTLTNTERELVRRGAAFSEARWRDLGPAILIAFIANFRPSLRVDWTLMLPTRLAADEERFVDDFVAAASLATFPVLVQAITHQYRDARLS